MKTTKKRKVPASFEDVDEFTCDLCGKPSGEDEPTTGYEVREVTIECVTGISYPEGGSKAVTAVDCCVACWKAKALPALVAAGFKPRTEETDY